MKKIVEVLTFNSDSSNFDEFIVTLVERLKSLKYCKKLIVTIEKVDDAEVRVTLITPTISDRDNR